MDTILDYLQRLRDHAVEYVVVGGVAAILHGSSHVTEDLDICAPLDEQNLRRILDALRDLHPRFRMHPNHPPLFDDVQRLIGFRNLNLMTDWGILDILGEITGIGSYEEVSRHTTDVQLGQITVRILDLPSLIRAKRETKRPKDLRAVPELEFILRQSQSPKNTEG
ncbi:MAG TPA: hypothetical protein VHP11_04720 [Tepidisphaeraceae bacterium]|nr:hypothetical protein [Tepidisphaeraceae bacterium]